MQLLGIFFNKKDAKPRMIWWKLLLQDFDLVFKDRNGTQNQRGYHLSRLEDFSHMHEKEKTLDEFSDKLLIKLDTSNVPLYADLVNLVLGEST